MNATRPPGFSQRRARARNVAEAVARDVAQPEAGEQRVDRTVRLGPGVADVEVRAQPVRDQPLAGRARAAPALASYSDSSPFAPAAATTSRCRRRARRSRPRSAGRPASDRRRRARRPRRHRGSAPRRSGRGADTSRRTRARAPRSTSIISRSRSGVAGSAAARAAGGAAAGRRSRPGRAGAAASRPAARGPRSASAWCRRKRRKPLSPALPTQSGQSCAQPSRSSGPRRRMAGAAPQAGEGRAERHVGPTARSDGRPDPIGRRDVHERVRIQDLGQQLDAVDDPRAGPAEVRRPVDGEDLRRDGRPAGPRYHGGLGVRAHSRTVSGRWNPHGMRKSISGRPRRRRPRSSRPALSPSAPEQVPAARPPDLLGHPVARRRTAGRATRAPTTRGARGPASRRVCDPRLDRAEPLAQRPDELHRLVLGLGHRPDRGDRVEDALDRRGLERDDRDVGVDRAGRPR